MSELGNNGETQKIAGTENMIQHTFNEINRCGNDLMETIKKIPEINRRVKEAHSAYLAEKDKISTEIDKTPIVTADDIRDEMYR